MTTPPTDASVVFTPILDRIAQELSVAPRQVTAAVALLDEGATVPFIARYRKEATGGLDDTQLREQLMAPLRLQPGARVLETGCGT